MVQFVWYNMVFNDDVGIPLVFFVVGGNITTS